MPATYGSEFRLDVIDAARMGGEAPLAQIAKDFGLSVTTLMRWTTIADHKESGPARRWFRPRYGSGRSAIVYCSRRIRFCVGRLTIWPETPTQNDLPACLESCRRHCSRRGDLQDVEFQQVRLLPLEGQPGVGTRLDRCAHETLRPGHPRRRPCISVLVNRRQTPGEWHH
ncbi:hypothetical protein HD598_000263 [Neomicrococcus aestuarii]|uniref:Uncharacterized protein n=1 Tax=Neomicrococcus aestuarii TaxID=556325 RepID=A0A7W8TU56_9MICC|nr:hypothetical protein [Neomicrococcus aestuarii]